MDYCLLLNDLYRGGTMLGASV